MQNFWKISFLAILFSCSHSSYKLSPVRDDGIEIYATKDRIILECTPMSEEYKNFAFHIFVLTDKDEVTNIMRANLMDNESCLWEKDRVSKLMENGKTIYIAATGSTHNKEYHDKSGWEPKYFPEHGAFLKKQLPYGFMSIENDKGECYSAHGKRGECLKVGEDFLIAPSAKK